MKDKNQKRLPVIQEICDRLSQTKQIEGLHPAAYQHVDKQFSQKLSNVLKRLDPVFMMEPAGAEASTSGRLFDRSWMTDSLNEEKRRFLDCYESDSQATPNFYYPNLSLYNFPKLAAKLQRSKQEMLERKILEHNETRKKIIDCYLAKIEDELNTIGFGMDMKQKNDHGAHTFLKEKYGDLNTITVNHAKNRYQELLCEPQTKLPRSLTKEVYGPKDLYHYFKMALEMYNMLWTEKSQTGWKIKMSDKLQAIDVRDRTPDGPTILIPKNRAKVSVIKLLELIAHEIEGHALQCENGRQSGFHLLAGEIRAEESELIYEGVAMYRQKKAMKELFDINNRPMPYAVLGLHFIYTEKANFRETFDHLLELAMQVSPKKSKEELADKTFNRCRRLFRSVTDLKETRGCACPKDKVYLEQEVLMDQLEKMGLVEYTQIGAINTRYIPLLVELGINVHTPAIPFQNVTKHIWDYHLKEKHQG